MTGATREWDGVLGSEAGSNLRLEAPAAPDVFRGQYLPCKFEENGTYFEELVDARHRSCLEGTLRKRTELTNAFPK